jgi:ABC-2 type transport system ATP-binding protein
MRTIETRDLSLSYGQRRGISGVNLQVEAGEIFGFLGPNGAGKSTTIRILMGLMRATSGTAQIFGMDCWSDGPQIRRDVGYVAGDVRLYSWLTTRTALKIASQVHGRNLMPFGLQLAERFRLEPDLDVRKMSRGNRQKVALVLALAHQPQLAILDEPTSGLDPLMQDSLMACLREMADQGRTVMFSSHTLSEVEVLCHRLAIVRDGQIVEDCRVQQLKQRAPRHVMLRLNQGQSIPDDWPGQVSLVYVPGRVGQNLDAFRVEPELKDRTILLELTGSSAELVQWASTHGFGDVMIGPPALEALFRKYYETSETSP